MKILYDAMGSDHGPIEFVKAALEAKEKHNITPVLVGDKDQILQSIKELDGSSEDIEIIHADGIISNDDEPVMAIRRKKDSSMVVAMTELLSGEYGGMISAGSTGALLAGGLLIIKRIKGIKRTPIALSFPTLKGSTLLLDGGANVDTDATILNQFGTMGSVYCSDVLDIENPTVGLLNIGTESNKGNSLTKEAYKLLKDNKNINFVGNIEADKVPFGAVDVLISDGFSGNVLLKMYEGVAKMFGSLIKGSMAEVEDEQLLGQFQKMLSPLMSVLDYSDIAGAPLLGLNKPLIKAHGNSTAAEILGATNILLKYTEKDVANTLKDYLKEG